MKALDYFAEWHEAVRQTIAHLSETIPVRAAELQREYEEFWASPPMTWYMTPPLSGDQLLGILDTLVQHYEDVPIEDPTQVLRQVP